LWSYRVNNIQFGLDFSRVPPVLCVNSSLWRTPWHSICISSNTL
jgi:hypothetical protein